MNISTNLLKLALPILEQLERDHADGKVTQEVNGWGRAKDPAAVTINEQSIALTRLIRDIRAHIKVAEKCEE